MNWDLIGHEWAVQILKQHIGSERLRHAYLLTGPQGVGRRTLALRMAQAINCPQPLAPGDPCRACRTCSQIERMQYPDLAIVQAEQVGGTLKVDQVRQLQHTLSLAPYEARYRVAVLLRFEEANPNAANALLKTLEEPPSKVVLVLTAESAEALMPTIVSRCEVLRLRPLPLHLIEQELHAQWGLPSEQANLLAHLSGGCPGYALRLHQEPERLTQRLAWLDDLGNLLHSGRVERFNYAESLVKDREKLRGALLVWASYWRDVMLLASGSAASLTNLDREREIKELANTIGLGNAHRILMALERTLDLIERNINARLATEVLMLDLPMT